MYKLKNTKYYSTEWETKAVNITTNQKEKVSFCLPEFSTTKIVTWECHVYDSYESRHNMILG